MKSPTPEIPATISEVEKKLNTLSIAITALSEELNNLEECLSMVLLPSTPPSENPPENTYCDKSFHCVSPLEAVLDVHIQKLVNINNGVFELRNRITC